jgi:hypothetical protein
VLEFVGEQQDTAKLASEPNVIEFITHINNPDGEIRARKLPGRTAVWDMAYYW